MHEPAADTSRASSRTAVAERPHGQPHACAGDRPCGVTTAHCLCYDCWKVVMLCALGYALLWYMGQVVPRVQVTGCSGTYMHCSRMGAAGSQLCSRAMGGLSCHVWYVWVSCLLSLLAPEQVALDLVLLVEGMLLSQRKVQLSTLAISQLFGAAVLPGFGLHYGGFVDVWF